jgi:NitT/TauT family transport system substrate-binding protein
VIAALSLGALATACGSSSPSSSGGTHLVNVSYRTGFTFGAWDTGMFVARDLGYYKAAGLNVTISPGLGSSSNVQLVATGKVDFANAAGSAVVEGVAKGAPITMVGAYIQEQGAGIATIPSIKTVAEMNGHTLSGSAYDFTTLLFPAFKAAAHLTNVPVADVNPAAIPQVLLTGKAQMMVADGWAEVPEMQVDGLKFTYFSYAKYGVNTMGTGEITSDSMLKDHPGEVKAFETASMKGWHYVYDHPVQAAQMMNKDVPAISLNVATAICKVMASFAHTPASDGKPLGWMAASDWTETVTLLKTYGLITTTVPISQLYTNVIPES